MNAPRSSVEFYFDFSSPYSYIASEWVEAVAARHARPVRWHAILLGATFQPAELRPAVAHPVKREYVLADFERSARFEGVPFRAPERFPIATQNAARAGSCSASHQNTRAADWAHAGLRAYFTRGVQLDERDALRGLCTEAGLDPDAAEAAWNDPRWKQRLKAENDAAIAAGVFGGPTFIIDGEMFWGNDRKPQIERWLAGGPF